MSGIAIYSSSVSSPDKVSYLGRVPLTLSTLIVFAPYSLIIFIYSWPVS